MTKLTKQVLCVDHRSAQGVNALQAAGPPRSLHGTVACQRPYPHLSSWHISSSLVLVTALLHLRCATFMAAESCLAACLSCTGHTQMTHPGTGALSRSSWGRASQSQRHPSPLAGIPARSRHRVKASACFWPLVYWWRERCMDVCGSCVLCSELGTGTNLRMMVHMMHYGRCSLD